VNLAVDFDGAVILSEGTLRPQDLMVAFADFAADTLKCQDKAIYEVYSFLQSNSDDEEERRYLLDDLINLMEDLAPVGYYFGTAEGDGACFGYFPFDEQDY